MQYDIIMAICVFLVFNDMYFDLRKMSMFPDIMTYAHTMENYDVVLSFQAWIQ